jgi:chemotaxis protein MotB
MIRKKRHAEESMNPDRWIVSYADFITVLFAFFVVLFASLNQDNHSIRKGSQFIHNGFEHQESISEEHRGSETRYPEINLTKATHTPLAQPTSILKSNAEGVTLEELQKELKLASGEELRDQEVTLHVTPEGFVVSLEEMGFFKSGEAVLRPGAAEKIERITEVLSEDGFSLRVEGHSDNQPIHNAKFRSNWELSTARAMTVLLFLLRTSKFDPSKLSLAGYGPYRPIADNVTAEGRGMNRRVDLVVVVASAPDLRVP